MWGAGSGTHRLSGVSSTVVLSWTDLPNVLRGSQLYFRSADVPLGSHCVQAQELLPSFPAAHPVPRLRQPLSQPRPLPHLRKTDMAVGHQSAGGWYIKHWLFFLYKINVQTSKFCKWQSCWVVRCKGPASSQLCWSCQGRDFGRSLVQCLNTHSVCWVTRQRLLAGYSGLITWSCLQGLNTFKTSSCLGHG